MSEKWPWFKWYPTDWLADEKLRTCSLAARGLWMDLVSLMHKSDRRGFLQQASGKPYTPEQLARIVGCTVEEFSRLLQELKDAGAFSVTEDEVLFCRRMVKEEQLRQTRATAGAKGGKATADLLKQTAKQKGSKQASKGPSNPLASDSLASGSSKGIVGGVGEERGTGPPSAADLAQCWCQVLSATKNGRPRDCPGDVENEFAELLRLGYDPVALREAVLDPKRDRAEYFFRFKDRFTGAKSNGNHHTGGEPVSRRRTSEASLAAVAAKAKRIDSAGTPERDPGAPEAGTAH
jgi:hypothetical protein